LTFGVSLRAERNAMNWSREHLEHVIRTRCKNDEHPVSAATIKAIENGLVSAPRNGTRAILCRIFPKLSISIHA